MKSTLSNREKPNPYSPTSTAGVIQPAHRLASHVWSIILPTAIASVVGSILFRSYFASVGDPRGGSISAGVTGLLVLPFVLLLRSTVRTFRSGSSDSKSTALVANGHQRVLDGIKADVRPEIEHKYAVQWNASGLIKRWFLRRRIEREIANCIAERSAHISPDSLF